MGFGTEILFILVLGLLVLGPKRLHTLMAQVARTKRQLEEAVHGFKSQLAAELADSGPTRPASVLAHSAAKNNDDETEELEATTELPSSKTLGTMADRP